MAKKTWKPAKGGIETIDALREELTKLAKKKKGKDLIDDKFTRDHIFAGHGGDVQKLGIMLAKLRELPASTLMITSMDAHAQGEVLNWVDSIAANKLTYAGGTWTLSTNGSTVPAANSYKFATVDLEELKKLRGDDIRKKSNKWLTVSTKTPKVACQFDDDGTPLIYHLDF